MNSHDGQLVWIGEAAEALGVTARYLRKLEAEGSIPCVKRNARGFRVYAGSDLEVLKGMGVGSRPRKLKRAPEEALERAR